MTTPSRDLATVRAEVRSLLERTPAFRAMPPADKKALANSMVRVGAFLSDDPAWLAEAQAAAPPPQEEKKDPVGDLGDRLSKKQGLVGQEFKAGAVREGVEQFGELVKKVDVPNFVSGLVNGVFRAVVEASMAGVRSRNCFWYSRTSASENGFASKASA
jgi:hypothetical protein